MIMDADPTTTVAQAQAGQDLWWLMPDVHPCRSLTVPESRSNVSAQGRLRLRGFNSIQRRRCFTRSAKFFRASNRFLFVTPENKWDHVTNV